jgi:hypothetical protein
VFFFLFVQFCHEQDHHRQGPCLRADQHWARGWEWCVCWQLHHVCSLWVCSCSGNYPCCSLAIHMQLSIASVLLVRRLRWTCMPIYHTSSNVSFTSLATSQSYLFDFAVPINQVTGCHGRKY